MRNSQQRTNGEDLSHCDLLDTPKAAVPSGIPFVQRLTCTIPEACEVTDLGRTKLYELIGDGKVSTTTIGRRRLVWGPSEVRYFWEANIHRPNGSGQNGSPREGDVLWLATVTRSRYRRSRAVCRKLEGRGFWPF
jgi:excisionase family DNA binding protein